MNKIFLALAPLVLFACTAPYHTTVVSTVQQPVVAPNPAPNQEENSYQVFYDQLGQYGKWIDYPGQGYVWSPSVDQDFQPYATNGQWVYTDQGWTWASDYPWGWAAFHYGRWFYEDGYGWLWTPGHQWAPAWVTWGKSGNYYGWAPLGPNVDANQQWTPPQRSWTFVPQEHMNEKNVGHFAADRNTTNTIIRNTTIINNITTVNTRNVVNNNVNNNVTNKVTNNNVTNSNVTNNRVNNTNETNNTVNNNTTNHVSNNTQVNNTTNTVNKNNANNITTNNSNAINHFTVNKGPQFEEVQKVTPAPIAKATILENTKPVQTTKVNNTLVVYKPVIQPNKMQNDGSKPKPQKVEPYIKK